MSFKWRKEYYFDYAAFTSVDRSVLKKMFWIFKKQSGTNFTLTNPISTHTAGRRSKEYIAEAREVVARKLNLKDKDVFFTSGATEANQIAIRTAILNTPVKKPEIIVGGFEHDSVLRIAKFFERFGVKVLFIDDIETIPDAVNENTALISVQYVNSVSGSVNNIRSLSHKSKLKNKNVLFHTDASQAALFYDCAPSNIGVDMITLDATKMNGVQGVGLLAILKSYRFNGISGERSSWDIRPGTPPVASIVGFAEIFKKLDRINVNSVKDKRDHILSELKKYIPDTYVYSIGKEVKDIPSLDQLAPHILSIQVPGINNKYLSVILDKHGFYVGNNTACEYHTNKEQLDLIRISISEKTTKREITKLIRKIRDIISV